MEGCFFGSGPSGHFGVLKVETGVGGVPLSIEGVCF